MNFIFAGSCVLVGLIALLHSEGFAGGVQEVDATHVRLLPGSPFFDRQEMHRTDCLAAWSCDKLFFPYRALAGLKCADSGLSRGNVRSSH